MLVNLAATLWAAGVAMRVRSIQGGPLMQFPVFLILFLAPVYVPLALLSGWIHAVASVNPVTALLEAGRGFISGDADPGRAGLRGRRRPAGPLRPLGTRRPASAPKPPADAGLVPVVTGTLPITLLGAADQADQVTLGVFELAQFDLSP